jgi:hypothetical protein
VSTVFTLAFFALLFPPTAEYLFAFIILCWLVKTHRRVAGAERGWSWETLPADARTVLKVMIAGPLAFWATALLSSVAAGLWSDYPVAAGASLEPFAHLFIKRCLLWWVLGVGMVVAYQRGWRLEKAAKPLAALMAVYFVYALAQRYTGVDWSHGLDARLGQNRFAYDVYRVSGFMGHPIPLSYNLMALVLTVAAVMRRHGSRERAWFPVLAVAAGLVLVSGSRWPLVVLVVTALLCEAKALFRWAKWVALASVGAAAALWAEGSVARRVMELFEGGGPLYEKVPRLLFWRTHWNMFVDHPLVGTGYVGYDRAIVDYYEKSGFGDFRERYTAHNMALQTLADSGLLGMVGLLALVAACVHAARLLGRGGRPQSLSYLIWATVVGALMQNLLRDTTYLFALALCGGALLAEATVPRPSSPVPTPPAGLK